MAGKTVDPNFVPIQKHREPGANEKSCPPCSGTGSIDSHVCKTCHGSGVVSKDWTPGDKTTSQQGTPDKGPAK